MKLDFLTLNYKQTQKTGQILAEEILKFPIKKQALVLGLEGDLGGGKTTFLQGFAKGLGIKEKITSPTFVIMRSYDISKLKRQNKGKFFHLDCYRIQKEKEVLSLGFKEIINNPYNIVAVEWAERIKKIIPKDALIIKFDFINKNSREIVIKLKNGN